MRRGWILLLTLVVLLFGGGFAWWWSTPGQLWWMTKKWEWWVEPRLSASPGGIDPYFAAHALDPQWSRLLRRKVVVPYLRVWDPAPTEEQIDRFWKRAVIKTRLPFPDMLSGRGYIDYWIDGERVPSRSRPPENARRVFTVQLLIPPDQHAVVIDMTREIFGNEGKTLPEEIPAHWQPHLPTYWEPHQ